MANVVVVGAQWGDEGKGKIVDWLSIEADVVVRFQGGHNAGHTLVIDGKVFKLSLLPSGIVRPGKLSVIGNGVVVDPHHLVKEIGDIRAKGVSVTRDNLRVAENAPLILSVHRQLDALRENSSEGTKIGTTQRGIGPAYEDKVGRRAIRVMDLADLSVLGDKIARLLGHHNAIRRGLGLEEILRRPALNHVAGHRERSAHESDHRHAARERAHHLLDGFANVAQIVRVRDGEAIDVIRGPHRVVDHRALALGEAKDRKSTRLNSSHIPLSRMPSSA